MQNIALKYWNYPFDITNYSNCEYLYFEKGVIEWWQPNLLREINGELVGISLYQLSMVIDHSVCEEGRDSNLHFIVVYAKLRFYRKLHKIEINILYDVPCKFKNTPKNYHFVVNLREYWFILKTILNKFSSDKFSLDYSVTIYIYIYGR